MNIREGMRRIGILLGAAGGIMRGVLAYSQGQILWNARSTHLRFESLMALPTMQRIAKDALEYQTGLSYVDSTGAQVGGATAHAPVFLDYNSLMHWAETIASKRTQLKVPPGYVLVQPQPEAENIVVQVNLDGIKEVYVDKVGIVTEIDLTTGESLPRTNRPHLKAYLLLLLYPVLGFLVPWGCIRLLTWVGTGFVEPRE